MANKMKTIKISKEHYEKYSKLLIKKGNPNLDLYMPATRNDIIDALNDGDIHLNTIKLPKWDGRANNIGYTSECDGKKYASLAEQVCALKHYAIFIFAGFKPDFTD